MASTRKEQTHITDIVTTDQTRFFLSPGKWEEFCDSLERPPRSIPELKKLFQEEWVWSDKGKDGN
jgi:uncharacterized protein (DUF1778 family)